MLKKNKYLFFFILIFIFIFSFYKRALAEIDILTLPTLLDNKCLDYKCSPFSCKCCRKFICVPGDKVCHYVPKAFVEKTRGSFESIVTPIDIMIKAFSVAEEQKTGGSTGRGQQEHLQFYESHMFVTPTWWYLKLKNPIKRLCNWSEGFSFELNYVSEIDSVNWRTGLFDYLISQFWGGAIANVLQLCPLGTAIPPIQNLTSEICMGTWGVTYPRVGFSSVNSEALASAIATWRTTRIVSNPIGRVVLFPKRLSKDIKMQMAYPKFATPENCIFAGTAQPYWDNMTALKGEKGYIWVIWEKICCCKCPATGCVGID